MCEYREHWQTVPRGFLPPHPSCFSAMVWPLVMSQNLARQCFSLHITSITHFLCLTSTFNSGCWYGPFLFFFFFFLIMVRAQHEICLLDKLLSTQYDIINYRDSVTQQISRRYSSSMAKTLDPLNRNFSFPPTLSHWQLAFCSVSGSLTISCT